MGLTIEELAGQYHQAWVDLNPDTIVALHSDDSVFHMHGAAKPATGRSSIHDLVAAFVRLVPDLRFELKRLYLGTDHIALEYNMSGTYEGSPFVCDGADVIAVADGLVTRKDTYLDYLSLIDQIGTMPQIVPAV